MANRPVNVAPRSFNIRFPTFSAGGELLVVPTPHIPPAFYEAVNPADELVDKESGRDGKHEFKYPSHENHHRF